MALSAAAASPVSRHVARAAAASAASQGLTRVHLSAQPEPCLTYKNTLHTLNTPYHPLNTGYTTPYPHPLSH
jgi:hypothetical protein